MNDYLEKQQENMLYLLEQLVNIDSGTSDKAGVDRIGALMATLYRALGLEVNVFPEADYGNHLVVRASQQHKPTILIITHMDTVFEKGTAKLRPFLVKDNRAYGPGVIDMKASLVAVYFAMKALKEIKSKAFYDVEILLTSDEEIGSVTSKSLIESHAKDKKFALVMEPARKNGAIVSARRGKAHYTLEVFGKAAHSGIEPEKGRSAIEELAHKIIQLHDITDEEKGIHVNVGIIEGGSSVNTISDHASAEIDVRFRKQEQADQIEQKIEDITSHADIEGTKVRLEGRLTVLQWRKRRKPKVFFVLSAR